MNVSYGVPKTGMRFALRVPTCGECRRQGSRDSRFNIVCDCLCLCLGQIIAIAGTATPAAQSQNRSKRDQG
jgi:hypothetical protein